MSLQQSSRWVHFVTRLQDEPLADLCTEFHFDEQEVVHTLIQHRSGPLQELIWWPEARRSLVTGESAASVARKWSTTPGALLEAMREEGLAAPRLGDLLANVQRTRGRMRIVRPDPRTPAPTPALPTRRRELPARSLSGKVRVLDIKDVDLSELTPPISRLVAPPAAPPAARRVAAPEPVAAPPVAPSAPLPRQTPLAPPEAPRAERPRAGWGLRLDGQDTPLVAVAEDIQGAALIFAQRVGEEALRRGHLFRIGLCL